MAKQSINRGSTANDGTGDNIRAGAGKINDNFDEIYSAIGNGTTITTGNFLTDTSSNTVQNKIISGSSNTLSNIPNSALTNNAVSLGGVSVNLGGTDATPAFDLTDATNYPAASLSGSIANSQLANKSLGLIDKVATTSSIDLGGNLTLTGGTAVSTAVAGGTFTISNGGVFGSLLSTPILNAPQTAILGMHAIQERPVAVNGEIVIRPMMYLAMSYDHRLLDGKEAVRFLVSIKEQLESPERLLLNL